MIKKKNYTIYKNCRSCGSKEYHQILDLGEQPLAGGFIKNPDNFGKEKKYSLKLFFCSNCYLVQTNLVINADTLFKNYYYSSSAINTLVSHFEKFAKELKFLIKPGKKPFAIEIGSNDGIFLKILKKTGFNVLGVDPSNLAKNTKNLGITTINDYFTLKTSQKIQKKYGNADLIVSSNTLAHIENMHDVLDGIYNLLKAEGVLIFENHYLVNFLKETQYDMVYHEHQYYYSLLSLNNLLKFHNLEIYDAKEIPTHAGSIRLYVKKSDNFLLKKTKRYENLLSKEKMLKLNKLSTYQIFNKRVKESKDSLIKILKTLKDKGKHIVGYGASGRGTVISNFCSLDSRYLSFIVDDSILKQNLYTPGTHLQIFHPKKLIEDKIEYVLLFAWPFANEIKKRNKRYLLNGGTFIVPLPKARIIK